MQFLWPIKSGVTVFDVWFIVHFAFWLVVGAQVQVVGWSRMTTCLVMLVVATSWEIFERGAFRWWPHIWKSLESWPNAIIGDVLIAGTVGVLVGFWLAEHQ